MSHMILIPHVGAEKMTQQDPAWPPVPVTRSRCVNFVTKNSPCQTGRGSGPPQQSQSFEYLTFIIHPFIQVLSVKM